MIDVGGNVLAAATQFKLRDTTRPANTQAPKLDRNKYLVPQDITMGEFMFIIRKRMKLSSEESIYMFVGNDSLAPVSHTMGMIYNSHKDDDQFLYVKYSGESTFG